LEVPVVTQAIGAYREITVSPLFREIERLRADARHNEASALANVERKERERWQGVVAEKDAALATALAEKNAALALIAELRARLGEGK
jgi:hypothetical protein